MNLVLIFFKGSVLEPKDSKIWTKEHLNLKLTLIVAR